MDFWTRFGEWHPVFGMYKRGKGNELFDYLLYIV